MAIARGDWTAQTSARKHRGKTFLRKRWMPSKLSGTTTKDATGSTMNLVTTRNKTVFCDEHCARLYICKPRTADNMVLSNKQRALLCYRSRALDSRQDGVVVERLDLPVVVDLLRACQRTSQQIRH